jgi:hypothetical protein
MITHTSSFGTGGPSGPDPSRAKPAQGEAFAPAPAADRLSTASAAGLRSALAATPTIRPEAVERAKALALDPNYPPLHIIERVAKLIADSQDPSEIAD